MRHCWDATAPCRQVGGTLRLTAALSSSGLHVPGPFRQRGGAVAAAPGRPLQVSASWWRRPPLRRSSDVSSVSQEDPQRGQEVPQGVRHRTQGPVVHGLPLEESLSALPGLRKRRRKSSRHAMSVEEKSVSTSGKMKVSIFFFGIVLVFSVTKTSGSYAATPHPLLRPEVTDQETFFNTFQAGWKPLFQV